MSSEYPEPPRITGSLQALIFLESIPYFTTVGITSELISLVLAHDRLEWDEVFKWRSICFAIFSFLMLSLANYGDRISNGRFYVFIAFLLISFSWTPLVIVASNIDTILVFASCLQPLLMVREAARICYITQPLLVMRRIAGIRYFFFLLFLVSNIGAFLFIVALKNMGKSHAVITALVCQPLYLLLVAAAFSVGGNVVAHRNVVERGFKCLILKFDKFLRRILFCKFYQNRPIKDYRAIYDAEIVTCTECMMQLSVTLAPFVIFFATVEMIFYSWVRDYDVMVDLGFAKWEITLLDVFHSFNIMIALMVYVVILPLVQFCIHSHVHEGVLLCAAYFILLICWISTASLQYANELQQTPYPKENHAGIVIFSNIEKPSLIDSEWTRRQWISSGDVQINKIKLTGLNSTTTDTTFTVAKIYQNKTKDVPTETKIASLKSVANSTVCYLLTSDTENFTDLKVFDDSLNRHFMERTKNKPRIFGHLFTLCSRTLIYGPPYDLVIQHLRTRIIQTVQICQVETSITNLSVGWYTLFLQSNSTFVHFEMLIGIQREALHYLYIEKGSGNFTEFKGRMVSLSTPFFSLDKVYFLIPLGLFAGAFTVGMVSLHSFVLLASPRHLHEFGFAIMYTTWSVGGGVAGLCFRYFCAHSRGMFYWIVFLVFGLLLLVRNVVLLVTRPHMCGPDGWVLEDALRQEAKRAELEPVKEEPTPQNEIKTASKEPEHPVVAAVGNVPEPQPPSADTEPGGTTSEKPPDDPPRRIRTKPFVPFPLGGLPRKSKEKSPQRRQTKHKPRKDTSTSYLSSGPVNVPYIVGEGSHSSDTGRDSQSPDSAGSENKKKRRKSKKSIKNPT
ncbi:hypothetical protein GE061_007846 [Apolygus lucorum]|uniref:Uncharacterized protein n=1 Tax=Apolygus lucorum TaxID=248454 RepID=A0A8S9WPI9_APOLU|nr:hypothetical protein GE061_007846 [Apolygus lucorum]